MNSELSDSRKWVVENAKLQIKHYQELIEKTEDEIKKSEWMNGKDKKKIKSRFSEEITIQCNYKSWKVVKEERSKDDESLFFLEILSRNYSKEGCGYITLSTEKAKQLRDYLNQKIEYLES